MAYLADPHALYLARNSNFPSETLYKCSQSLVDPEYAKNAILTNRSNVRILTSTATCIIIMCQVVVDSGAGGGGGGVLCACVWCGMCAGGRVGGCECGIGAAEKKGK